MLLLGGCLAQSDIQRDYALKQSECRSLSSWLFTSSDTTKGGSGNYGAQFSDCMRKAGYNVSQPKPQQVATGPAPNPPTGSPSTNPSAATSSARRTPAEQGTPEPASSTNAPPAKNTVPTAQRQSIGPLDTQPITPGPATYQPARPIATRSIDYGKGAGRQFK